MPAAGQEFEVGGKLKADTMGAAGPQVDIWRDTWVRYLGECMSDVLGGLATDLDS